MVALVTAALVFGLAPPASSQPTQPPVPAPTSAAPAPAAPPSAPARSAPVRKKLLAVRFEAGCVVRGPAEVRAYPDLWNFDGERFDWVLRGPTATTSGRVEWLAEDEQYGPLDFRLNPGRYGLIITRVGRNQVVVDKSFDVMRCVTVTTSCHAVTFANPAGNPAAWVEFAGGEYLDVHDEETGKGGSLTVKSGRSVTVRTYHEEIAWSAYGPGADRESSSPNAGEHYSELIEQHCGPTRTRGVISCATGRRGVVRAWFHPPDNRRLGYRIDKWDTTVRNGRPGRDRYLKLKLRVGPDYTFRSYSAAAALPYDRAEHLRVVRCVTAKRRGKTVRFHNPSGPTVRVAYRISGSPTKIVLRLKRGKSATIRVGSSTLRWHTNALRPTSRWRIDRGRGVLRS